jgi:DNA-binding response OmpR family regulator
MKKRIFAIDDETDIRDILRINLEKEGYDVETFTSGEEALVALRRKENPDLIILDIMMGGMDGYEFCKHVRLSQEYRGIPIIFLSAKVEEFDKVLGLELGGDDYITKPFGMKELKSRVKAVLRRAGDPGTPEKNSPVLVYKGLELNCDHYGLKINGAEIRLTKTEFEILQLFLRNPGKIFSRDNIIDSVKGNDVYVVDRTIDVHIMNLRKKLGDYKNIITTFSGVGYGFRE